MRSEGKIFLIAILVTALMTSLAAAMLTDGHIAEAVKTDNTQTQSLQDK